MIEKESERKSGINTMRNCCRWVQKTNSVQGLCDSVVKHITWERRFNGIELPVHNKRAVHFNTNSLEKMCVTKFSVYHSPWNNWSNINSSSWRCHKVQIANAFFTLNFKLLPIRLTALKFIFLHKINYEH